ncbi:DUF4258 domain-containing protein [Anaerolineales bacterium HSG24]|nr:DUF4258 domain-containing protein [Anaerolineales bacterium HSG24]
MSSDCPPLVKYILTDHAQQEMSRRDISEQDIQSILSNPQQTEWVRIGRCVYQSKIVIGDAKTQLLRVFVDVDRELPEVVTAYRTSKISKYWRQ